MPASEDLYVLARGEGEGENDGWMSPRPIDDAVETAASSYVDLDDVAAVLDDGDDSESVTFTVEGHDVTVDGGGHVTVASSD
ncbi:hypothetical protein BRC79_08375 [Halobacteriales archaeon QH_8_67_27]|nr:MAG: hypothetical protein BRC79_08375 [Halobacteriales archaeon QH_8_67_27]